MSEIVHRCPIGSESVTPCCGKTPFELPQWASRMTLDDSLVTCKKMTTDHDLLARIDFEITRWLRIEKDAGQVMSDGTHDSSISSSWKALRAVVELHKPREREVTPTPNDPFWYKVECSQCIEHETQADWIYAKYPCPTIQAIDEELG